MTDLARFHEAQAPAFATALAELQAGEKRTHWMWFVLPQLRGLGTSAMAQRYGVEDGAEAIAYLADPVLGARLRACVEAILEHRAKTAFEILGSPDDRKFHSCLTLFAAVAPDDALFHEALSAFYGGAPDPKTLRLLAADADDL